MSEFPKPFDPQNRVPLPPQAIETKNDPFHPSAKMIERLAAIRNGSHVEHTDARLFAGPKFRLLATLEEQDLVSRLAEQTASEPAEPEPEPAKPAEPEPEDIGLSHAFDLSRVFGDEPHERGEE